jgi:hypothetical protein
VAPPSIIDALKRPAIPAFFPATPPKSGKGSWNPVIFSGKLGSDELNLRLVKAAGGGKWLFALNSKGVTASVSGASESRS